MKFCSVCGHTVEHIVPPGDNRLRFVCPNCSTIHYQNPRIVVGAIPVYENQVLLCKRAIEPRYGYWTLPAGFMENGETIGEGASRETLEEADAVIELGALFSVLDVPHVDQVHMFFLARLPKPEFGAGTESLEVALFNEADVPWTDIAFRTVTQTLKWFFEDRRQGTFSLHTAPITYPPRPKPAG